MLAKNKQSNRNRFDEFIHMYIDRFFFKLKPNEWYSLKQHPFNCVDWTTKYFPNNERFIHYTYSSFKKSFLLLNDVLIRLMFKLPGLTSYLIYYPNRNYDTRWPVKFTFSEVPSSVPRNLESSMTEYFSTRLHRLEPWVDLVQSSWN